MATPTNHFSCEHWNCAHHDNTDDVCGLGGYSNPHRKDAACPLVYKGEVMAEHDEQYFFASDKVERASLVRTAVALLN